MIVDLISSAYFWYVLGIVLIVVDLVVGLEFFVLSFGVGAISTGLLMQVSGVREILRFPDSTNEILLFFGIASLVLIFPIRKIIYSKYKNDSDIIVIQRKPSVLGSTRQTESIEIAQP